ncbi:MAG: putative Ig domain-containing protein, partial [Deltaproteobacteria bacterium]|nr:putative Ig domain-containing protein [Deltaproteobacteria bacterium]
NHYLRRRMVHGIVRSSWDEPQLVYSNQEPSITSAIYGFHHRYNYAALPGPVAMTSQFLTDLIAYYGLGGTIDDPTRERLEQERKVFYHPYGLALCDDPSMLPSYQPETNQAPYLKALFKQVVRPGEPIHKEIVAADPDGDPLTLTVQDLPAGAAFDDQSRTISWSPTGSAAEVHVVQVTADDGQAQTTRPFAMILKPDAPNGPIPAGPEGVTAQMAGASAVEVSWTPPDGVTVAAYFVYRDGLLWAAVPGSATTWTDQELIVPGSNTRYHVSACATHGGESHAASATPGFLHIPAP